MHRTEMIAKVLDKATDAPIGEYKVVELRYSIRDNTLWITDHRNHIMDFDLNECKVQIVSIQ